MSEKISIVIPCYNESDNIDNTYQLLTNTIKNLVENYDIL